MKNTVHLIGRLGKDATTNEWQGKQVANFTLATSHTYKDKTSGEKRKTRNGTSASCGNMKRSTHT